MNKKDYKSNSDSLYLSKLKYKDENSKTWMNFFIRHMKVVALIIVFIFIFGAYGLLSMPLESTPEVKIPYATVSVVLPGASPGDVESLVLDKIEPAIMNIKGVKQMSSTAFNSMGVVSIEFFAGEDVDDSVRKIRDVAQKIAPRLPEDASSPVVQAVSYDNQHWRL